MKSKIKEDELESFIQEVENHELKYGTDRMPFNSYFGFCVVTNEWLKNHPKKLHSEIVEYGERKGYEMTTTEGAADFAMRYFDKFCLKLEQPIRNTLKRKCLAFSAKHALRKHNKSVDKTST